MKLQAYSIYDDGAETFSGPFFVAKEALGIRAFEQIVNDARSEVSRYPKDYCMFHIGSLNTVTGELASEKPTMVIRAHALLKKEDPRQLQIPGTAQVAPELNSADLQAVEK